jgi:hypothetical protein
MNKAAAISELNGRIAKIERVIEQIENDYIPDFLSNPFNAKYPENSIEVFEAMIESRKRRIAEIEMQLTTVIN